jgi:DNA-binding NarL/FixJ family response regulator
MSPEEALSHQAHEKPLPLTPTATAAPPTRSYPAGLTTRQVLRLLARGMMNGEIARELGLSEKTVAHHLTHIFNKTSSENRAAAVAFAIHHGLA